MGDQSNVTRQSYTPAGVNPLSDASAAAAPATTPQLSEIQQHVSDVAKEPLATLAESYEGASADFDHSLSKLPADPAMQTQYDSKIHSSSPNNPTEKADPSKPKGDAAEFTSNLRNHKALQGAVESFSNLKNFVSKDAKQEAIDQRIDTLITSKSFKEMVKAKDPTSVTKESQAVQNYEKRELKLLETLKEFGPDDPKTMQAQKAVVDAFKEVNKEHKQTLAKLADSMTENQLIPASGRGSLETSPNIRFGFTPENAEAILSHMSDNHVNALKSDSSPEALSKAVDFFVASAKLPPIPGSSKGLPYGVNDKVISGIADKIRADDKPGGVVKMGGGSGGVYKLSVPDSVSGSMKPLLVLKLEDEEPGQTFGSELNETILEDAHIFPPEQNIIREEFVNRSPLDARHIARVEIADHPQFNHKEGIETPAARPGVVFPFIRGSLVMSDLAAPQGSSRAIQDTFKPIQDKYGVDQSKPPGLWDLWKNVDTPSAQTAIIKSCLYGNTDLNGGNLMLLEAPANSGSKYNVYDFDYGRTVGQGWTSDYGIVDFESAPFMREPVGFDLREKVASLDIQAEVGRMEQTWTAGKTPEQLEKGKADLETQKEVLQAHMHLVKAALSDTDPDKRFTLDDVFTVLKNGDLEEIYKQAASSTDKWATFEDLAKNEFLPEAKADADRTYKAIIDHEAGRAKPAAAAAAPGSKPGIKKFFGLGSKQ